MSTQPYLDMLAGNPGHTPVWFMRQAGRSLPEYREIRSKIGMLDSCFHPEIACEITMQPVNRYDVDAAIFFSDIVVPLKACGVELDIVAGVGPVVDHPIQTLDDVERIPALFPEHLENIAQAVRLIRAELPAQKALIGFAGAPFTLASYMVEGGPSKNHEKTKAMMLSQPEVWHTLVAKLAEISTQFLATQVESGADAIQLFDSWAGTLSVAQYRESVAPHSQLVLQDPRFADIPRTHFGVGTAELLHDFGQVGATVVGVDWRTTLDDAASRVGAGKSLQGNLDPAILTANPEHIQQQVMHVLQHAKTAREQHGIVGHVFNLGHGVPPTTDPDVLHRIVDTVHEATQ